MSHHRYAGPDLLTRCGQMSNRRQLINNLDAHAGLGHVTVWQKAFSTHQRLEADIRSFFWMFFFLPPMHLDTCRLTDARPPKVFDGRSTIEQGMISAPRLWFLNPQFIHSYFFPPTQNSEAMFLDLTFFLGGVCLSKRSLSIICVRFHLGDKLNTSIQQSPTYITLGGL